MYIDFKQAFDSVKRDRMLEDLCNLGIPKKYISLIKMTLQGSKAAVRVDGELTPLFNINMGVREGDALPTMLFNLVLEAVIGKTNITGHINTKSVQITAYADDVAIISRNKPRLMKVFKQTDPEARKRGLKINEAKTKYMTVKRITDNENNITIDNYTIKRVDAFTYLGTEINQKNSVSNEINASISSGNRTYYANKRLITSKLLDKRTKMTIYKILIRPVVTYGCETWVMTKK
ncbi:unnamed protein product [Diabrotica balteata]|uniref:Reverse transcriptase domain-containing protein n=1 Tax=Diabrotica balteata TaxID=107213 RepID=A0A9N9TDZ0_DIABA|nr:unnamed protein product [Diabrotica balteata]